MELLHPIQSNRFAMNRNNCLLLLKLYNVPIANHGIHDASVSLDPLPVKPYISAMIVKNLLTTLNVTELFQIAYFRF